MCIEIEVESMFNVSDSIVKINESEKIVIINSSDFIKMLDLEFVKINTYNNYFELNFKIIKNKNIIGRIEIVLSNNRYSEDILYDEWFEKDYSMGIIALSIINQNLYYRFEKHKRIAIITYFILYDEKIRGNNIGSTAFNLAEEILKKIFKIDVIYLYSCPLDFSYNAKLYKGYIEDCFNNSEDLFEELEQFEIDNAIHEYETLSNKLDNFYLSNNMIYLNKQRHTFYKEI